MISVSPTRVYHAWTIYVQIGNQPPCVGYKAIDGKLPFFTTKKDAEQFIRSHFVKRPRHIKPTVRRVQVAMCEEDAGVD
jgi:hypothetical protein